MNEAILDRLKAIVGEDGWLSDQAALQPHLTEWRGTYEGRTPLMLLPRSTEQVASIVAECARSGTPLVPQGGNTGLCGGAVPDRSGEQILLGLSRLNRIRTVSPQDYSMVVEAGCTLAEVQRSARDHDRFFPLSLAAEGSCQIGGNLSTNAGGINVLRYGTARAQVLGLEVVLPSGTVWNGLRTLRKDTAGFDLKQLFIGAEGTLGVITASSLRLYPLPRYRETAYVAVPSIGSAVDLFSTVRDELADGLQAFELISARAERLVLRHIPGTRAPLGKTAAAYVLIEYAGQTETAVLERVLADALQADQAVDAVVAKSIDEQSQLWRLRHSISEAQKLEGASLKHDVSVPVGSVGRFIEAAEEAVTRAVPGCRVVAFGHVGDGNVHFNVSQPREESSATFLARRDAISTLVYDIVEEYRGSISAEHGVGVLKRADLSRYRSETEVSLMRVLKRTLDPENLMNPGKVL